MSRADRADDRRAALGLVPAEWLERRCIGTACHHGRFADVGESDSLAHLRRVSPTSRGRAEHAATRWA
jgi:hypothetical protein